MDILRKGADDFEVVLLSAHTNRDDLYALAAEFPGALLALSGVAPGSGAEKIHYYGLPGLLRAIADAGADIVVNGISGAEGLRPSMAALQAGADLALANKETIVMAAPLVFALAAEKQRRILPVDSEHSAIFNLIAAHGRDSVEEILLTASGGPFRKKNMEELAHISPQEALAHPTWKMGPKITIDSASLANKGLEVIEAAGLFGLPAGRIKVVVHPQSVVHSMVRLRDGAVYAQLSKPDMRLPIHGALYYPQCRPCSFGRLDFDALTLEFEKPDFGRFPMLPLAYEAARAGAAYPTAYNAANEVAAAAFLKNAIGFLDIPRIVDYVLNSDWSTLDRDIDSIMEADARARRLAEQKAASGTGA
jgi:1-deoxy-D-xylulose-5-phosphate reductoisomerase